MCIFVHDFDCSNLVVILQAQWTHTQAHTYSDTLFVLRQAAMSSVPVTLMFCVRQCVQLCFPECAVKELDWQVWPVIVVITVSSWICHDGITMTTVAFDICWMSSFICWQEYYGSGTSVLVINTHLLFQLDEICISYTVVWPEFLYLKSVKLASKVFVGCCTKLELKTLEQGCAQGFWAPWLDILLGSTIVWGERAGVKPSSLNLVEVSSRLKWLKCVWMYEIDNNLW